MTFSQTVKSEILKNIRKLKGCCATSFLTAVVKSIGSLELSFDGFYFSIESDNYELLTFCKNLAQTELDIGGEIQSANPNAKGAAVYTCEFHKNIGAKLGLTYRDGDGAMHLSGDARSLLPAKDCCKRAFMQGLLLAAGSVVIPVFPAALCGSSSTLGKTRRARATMRKSVLPTTTLPQLSKTALSKYRFAWLSAKM